ncbi:hypothetical protein ABFX02_07G031900 [Erythranthe guttata]
MAVSLSNLPFFTPSKTTSPNSIFSTTPKLGAPPTKHSPNFTIFASRPRNFTAIPKATQEEENENTATTAGENAAGPPEEIQPEKSQTELGNEIKAAMKERQQQKEDAGFLSGVAEEIKEIEWPAFNKVLGITGVVLGVIAGSSVVLLTVNAVLAEISDRVFVGKGVQDFFG